VKRTNKRYSSCRIGHINLCTNAQRNNSTEQHNSKTMSTTTTTTSLYYYYYYYWYYFQFLFNQFPFLELLRIGIDPQNRTFCNNYLRQGCCAFVVVCLFVCVWLLATLRKNFRTDLHEIFRQGWQWPTNKWLNFGGDPDYRLDTEIVFRIHHYWEIQTVANGHKSAAASSH